MVLYRDRTTEPPPWLWLAAVETMLNGWHQDKFIKDASGQKQSVNTASAYAYVKKKFGEHNVLLKDYRGAPCRAGWPFYFV